MTAGPPRGRGLQWAIVLATIVLVAVTWSFTLVSIGSEEREAQLHAESNVANLALAVEWQLQRQLQAIDEAMQGMAADWRSDPLHFDPNAWKQRSSLFGELSLQVTVLDATGFVTATTRPDLIHGNLSNRDYFQAQLASRRTGLFIGPAIHWRTTGRWEINLSRRLERGDGSFGGVIVVSYDPWTLTSMLEQVDLGPRGLIALVGDDGSIRALVSPYEVQPGQDISRSALFRDAVLPGNAIWTGPSAPDGVVRIHALRHLRDQDLTIIVGVDRAVALRAAHAWASDARTFAGTVSFALLIMAWLLVREVRLTQLREVRLTDSQGVLESAYAELAGAKANADHKSAELEATIAGMSDGVMVLDASFRLARWNDRFPAYTGTPSAILRVGLPMEEIVRAQALAGEFGKVDVEAEVKRRMDRLHAHSGVSVGERTRPNGRTLEQRRATLSDGGVVTLYIDVTARKQAEEAHAQARRVAEEAMRDKSRFVAIVSHEIRTPLNAVINSLALLDQSNLNPAQRTLAETALQAGEALLDLVRDILELTEAEPGRLALQPIAFELRAMLEGVRDMFAAQASARLVRLVVEVAPDVPRTLRADRGRLRQIVINLVSNASRFAAPGPITIHAGVATMAGRPALQISVRDQGPPVPEPEAAKLFQPFSKLENAFLGGASGTGLGLAICERLTRLMGGRIGLRASPEGGNDFWLAIPLEAAAPLADAVADLPAAPPARTRRARLLLVEDLAPNQLIAATILRRAGHLVDIAGGGAEALRLVRTLPYDLVLMDLVMPGMSGEEAARQIRAMAPPAGMVPVVALTATTAPEDRARCREAGMVEVLGKPIRPAELLATVARICGAGAASSGGTVLAVVPAPSDVPVLDDERLADLRRGLPAGTLEQLVEQCLEDIRERLPLLQQALLAGQVRGVEEGAHALAGMAGNFALSGLESRMRRIMAAVRGHDMTQAQQAAEGVEAELARCSEAIRLALRPAA